MEKVIIVVKNNFITLLVYDFEFEGYTSGCSNLYCDNCSFQYYKEHCSKLKIKNRLKTNDVFFTRGFYDNHIKFYFAYDLKIYFFMSQFTTVSSKKVFNSLETRILLILKEFKKKMRSVVGKDPTNIICSYLLFHEKHKM